MTIVEEGWRTRQARYDKIIRRVKLSTTYLRSISNILLGSDEPPFNEVTAWHWDLMYQALETAEDIISKLPDSFFDDPDLSDEVGERTGRMMAVVKERRGRAARIRMIKQMENVTGRTPEEAELYREKARELRAELEATK